MIEFNMNRITFNLKENITGEERKKLDLIEITTTLKEMFNIQMIATMIMVMTTNNITIDHQSDLLENLFTMKPRHITLVKLRIKLM